VAQIQGKNVEADLLRRDFTVNAMAWSPADGALLDPRGGREDLKRRLIRADRPVVFKEDALRLLRAFRQAAQLDFEIDEATMRHIAAHRRLVLRPAGERIRQELLGLFTSIECARWLEVMDRASLLTALFPELERSRRCAEVY